MNWFSRIDLLFNVLVGRAFRRKVQSGSTTPSPPPPPAPVPSPPSTPPPPTAPPPSPVPTPTPTGNPGALMASTALIVPDYGSSVPADGDTRTATVTGQAIKRKTQGLVVYSRYSPFNCDNTYILAHGENSTSANVINMSTHAVVRALPTIGETPTQTSGGEIRWDATDPDKFYYVQGMKFNSYKVSTGVTTLIRDFTSDFPTGSYIGTDVEGDCSLDNRYWCWMVFRVTGSGSYPIDAIFVYDKQANSILGTMTPASEGVSVLQRPNMCEMSPDGQWALIHWNDAYPGWYDQDINTHRDGPHVYAKTLNPASAVWLCPDSTHSGWAKDSNGVWNFVYQNNKTDWIEAIIPGVPYKTDGSNQIRIANQAVFDPNWNLGWHIAKSPYPYALISTYSSTLPSAGWAYNQLYFYPLQANATPLRVCANYTSYPGNDSYRNESPAALSRDGSLIAWSSNWGGSDARSVYVTQI